MERKSAWREISPTEALDLGLPNNLREARLRARPPHLTVPERINHLHEWLVYPWTEVAASDLPPGARIAVLVRSDPEDQARWEALHARGYYMAHCQSCGATRQEFIDEPKSVLEDDVGLHVSEEDMYKHRMESQEPTEVRGALDFEIPWPITAENAAEVAEVLQSARHVGENIRKQTLSAPAGAIPAGCARPIATVAENLAAAAMKLQLSRLETTQGRSASDLRLLVARYNECVGAFSDMWSLMKAEDWVTLRARYGATSRDSAPGCLKVASVLVAVLVHHVVRWISQT